MSITIFNVKVIAEKAGYSEKTNAYKRMSACFKSGDPELSRDEIKALSAVIRTETVIALASIRKLEKK